MNGSEEVENMDTPTSVSRLRDICRTCDAVYGRGWSQQNAAAVSRFALALAMQDIAREVAELRDVLLTGTGAVTVALDQPKS